jgi:hypothetical protein
MVASLQRVKGRTDLANIDMANAWTNTSMAELNQSTPDATSAHLGISSERGRVRFMQGGIIDRFQRGNRHDAVQAAVQLLEAHTLLSHYRHRLLGLQSQLWTILGELFG